MFENGFIKLWRSILNWEWYDDANTFKLFIHLLLTVSIKDSKWHGFLIKKGSRIASVSTLSQETRLTVREVRTALKHLETTGEVTRSKMPKFTIITVNNYGELQEATSKTAMNRQGGDNVTTRWRQQYKNNKEDIRSYKKEREDILPLGEYENVYLSEADIERLRSEFGEELVNGKIESLSEYMALHGKSYSDHYAAVRKFCREDSRKAEERKPSCDIDPPSYNLEDFEYMAMHHTPKC